MSVAATIIARVVDRLRSIDGAAHTFTLFGQSVSHTYAFDLTDADRVVQGLAGAAVPPPYTNVYHRVTPGDDGSNLCKSQWSLTLWVDGVASIADMLSSTEHTAALDLANDIVVAVMADRQATTAGSLRTLGVDGIRPSVDQIYGSDEGIDITACRVTFEITYQTTGIGL